MTVMLADTDLDYQIADGQTVRSGGAKFHRSMSFPEGVSSHTRVAVPDAIEANEMKIAGMETPPGIKCAAPEPSLGVKVAKPSGMSLTGDFRQTLKVSGGDSKDRRNIGLKLYAGSMNPAIKVTRSH